MKAYLLLTTFILAFFPTHLPNINHPVITPPMEADEQICTPPNESFFHGDNENLIPCPKDSLRDWEKGQYAKYKFLIFNQKHFINK